MTNRRVYRLHVKGTLEATKAHVLARGCSIAKASANTTFGTDSIYEVVADPLAIIRWFAEDPRPAREGAFPAGTLLYYSEG